MIEMSSGSKGIDWFLMTLSWSKDGLVADLTVDPRVEDFFVQLSGNQQTPISNYGGKDWSPAKEGDILSSYAINDESLKDSTEFVVGYPGFSFISERFGGKINLSFLHLVGASKGIKMLIKTPVSGIAKRDLRMRVERGMHEFVREYLTFGKIQFRVSSYDI